MKIIAKKANVASTAVQHVAKHFDLVLGIDIHWTKLRRCHINCVND